MDETRPESVPCDWNQSERMLARTFESWRAEFRSILEDHRREIQARLEKIERDPGELPRHLVAGQRQFAACRVMDMITRSAKAGRYFRQHHEMVEIPVQDRRQRQVRQILDFTP